jgi:hypothetical protein
MALLFHVPVVDDLDLALYSHHDIKDPWKKKIREPGRMPGLHF